MDAYDVGSEDLHATKLDEHGDGLDSALRVARRPLRRGDGVEVVLRSPARDRGPPSHGVEGHAADATTRRSSSSRAAAARAQQRALKAARGAAGDTSKGRRRLRDAHVSDPDAVPRDAATATVALANFGADTHERDASRRPRASCGFCIGAGGRAVDGPGLQGKREPGRGGGVLHVAPRLLAEGTRS